jgi:hypothetical protein
MTPPSILDTIEKKKLIFDKQHALKKKYQKYALLGKLIIIF